MVVELQSPLEAGLLKMTIPDKSRSSKQKCRLTEKGRKFLPTNEAGGEYLPDLLPHEVELLRLIMKTVQITQ